MASVATYLPGFVTGSGLGYPIVMKAGGINIEDYIIQLTIAVGTTTITLGSLVMVTTGALTADVTVAKDFTAMGIVILSTRNKTVLEKAGVTVAKGAAFPASVTIDVLLLVPGMVISIQHDAVATLDVGDDVRCAAAGQCAALAAIATDADPRTRIGRSLTRLVGTTGTGQYIAVMVC